MSTVSVISLVHKVTRVAEDLPIEIYILLLKRQCAIFGGSHLAHVDECYGHLPRKWVLTIFVMRFDKTDAWMLFVSMP